MADQTTVTKTWFDKTKDLVTLAIQADAHAILIISLGCLMELHEKGSGQPLIMAGLAVFKGKS